MVPVIIQGKVSLLSFWDLIKRYDVTWTSVMASILSILLSMPKERKNQTLKAILCGGQVLTRAVQKQFEDRFKTPIFEGYGLTETSPVASINTEDHHSRGTVGKPLPDTEVRIAEDGEVLVRGKHVTQGYYKLDDLTAQAIDADGWFHTGDLGSFGSAGYLTINGRKKNLIVLGSGKKVQPEEVEQPLEASPLFKEVCVLGLTSLDQLRQGQEEVGCVVVPSDEALGLHPDPKLMARAMEDEVSLRCKVLAGYKQPSCVIVHSGELPTTTTKKIKRTEVRALVNELRREKHDT